MKKWMSALLCLALILTACAGCGEKKEAPSGIYYDLTGIDPDETVMTVSGNEIPARLYFYWLSYTASNMEYNLYNYYQYYGAYSNMFDEAGNLNWDGELTEGQTLRRYVKDSAEDTIHFYAALENMAGQYGVEVTEEDRADMQAAMDSMVEELGSQEAFQARLDQMGITQAVYERLASTSYLFQHLAELVQQEGSALYLEPSGYDQYAVYADHILLSTVDTATREPLSDEEIAAKRATAEDILAQLQASDDVEALFAQLADEHSEDPGRETNPTGYIYTPGTMVTEFEDAAAALAPGQISGIVESDYGYHIILRKNLWTGLEADQEQKQELAEQHLAGLIQAAMEEDEVVFSEKLDGIDAGEFYTAYTAAVDAMTADDAGDASSSANGDSGSSNSGGGAGGDNKAE